MNLRAAAHLAVPEYIPMALTGLLTGAVASAGRGVLDFRLLIALGSATVLIAGYNSYNAIADLEIDAINKPTRPLPNGSLSVQNAKVVSLAAFAISLVLAALLGLTFFGIMAISSILAVAYSFPGIHLKYRFGWNTFTAALLYTFFLPLAGWAIFPANPVPVTTLALLFCFGLGTAVLKDFEDLEGDTKYKANTLPVALGQKGAAVFIVSAYAFTSIIIVFLYWLGQIQSAYLSALFFPLVGAVNTATLYNDASKRTAQKVFKLGCITLVVFELYLCFLTLI